MMQTGIAEELHELQRQRLALIDRRNELIAQADAMVAAANREFDELVIPLGSRINELRAALGIEKQNTPTKSGQPRKKTGRPRKEKVVDLTDSGLSDEEQDYYRALLQKGKK